VYTQRLREAFPGVPIILGGIEASLRRFAHYDFWEDRIRDPMLVDAPANLLVFGMAESVLGGVVEWYKTQASRERGAWPVIPQTCIRVPHDSWRDRLSGNIVILPSTDACRKEPQRFMELSVILDTAVRPGAPILVQPHPKGDVICFPPSLENWSSEPLLLDHLRFNRRAHPIYDEPVPGLEPVQFSVVSHRGCLGACAFCALAAHQGRSIRSRSPEAILEEIRSFTEHPDFRGTVPDVGGPSVNMYGWDCRMGGCERGLCTHPQRCGNIRGGLKELADLLRRARDIPGVKHVFLGSGLRFDLIRKEDWPAFRDIIRSHISGQLKVAPEHVDRDVLRLMRKGADANFPEFVAQFMDATAAAGRKLYLVPYFMTAFPGSAGKDGAIAELVRKLRLAHEQIQEFTPTPATIGTAMYATGLTPDGKPVNVSRGMEERGAGRREIQPGRRDDRNR
ncbi:MAG TPA: radical SAM protein, partial [Candidatus Ozemobacteraceae bacterium]|nr:radical SAM protein [Candidatus Ozemobacteraceae bacterium]